MSGDRFQSGKPEPQSLVKNAIVQKYFGAWATVMRTHSSGLLCYADLYAGEGMWDDGTPSNPLRILDIAGENPELGARLVTVFNDNSPAIADRLRQNIASHPASASLVHRPVVLNCEVGRENGELLAAIPDCPVLCLLDPTGYKGLSLNLIETIISGFGREVILFFNFNRIRPAVFNEVVEERMSDLFGASRFPSVRQRIKGLDGFDREMAILEEFAQALRERGVDYTLPFRFRDARGTRTMHYVVHVGTEVTGYSIMKDIMHRESSSESQGVASFEYNPVDEAYPVLFEYARPLDDLRNMLLLEFGGRQMRMDQVYREHHVGTRFVKKNYKDILREMEDQKLIKASPCAGNRRSGTFADSVVVTFPD